MMRHVTFSALTSSAWISPVPTSLTAKSSQCPWAMILPLPLRICKSRCDTSMPRAITLPLSISITLNDAMRGSPMMRKVLSEAFSASSSDDE